MDIDHNTMEIPEGLPLLPNHQQLVAKIQAFVDNYNDEVGNKF